MSADIVSTLLDLQELYSAHEDDFRNSQELARAMQRLRDDMAVIQEGCRRMVPVEEDGGIARLKAHIKAYRIRDDFEEELARLKEQVNICYAKFTVGFTVLVLNLLAYSFLRLGIFCRPYRERVGQDGTPDGSERDGDSGETS